MLPDALEWVLEMLGFNWPTADEDKLMDSAQKWRDFSAGVEGLQHQGVKSAGNVLSANTGDSIDGFQTTWDKFAGGSGYLDDARNAADAIAIALDAAAGLVIGMKVAVIAQLAILAAEIIAAQAAAPFTFGLSEIGAAAATGATRLIVRKLIKEAAKQLLDAALETAKEPAVSALQAMISDVIAQSVNMNFDAQNGFDVNRTVKKGAEEGVNALKNSGQTFTEALRDGAGAKAGHHARNGLESAAGHNNGESSGHESGSDSGGGNETSGNSDRGNPSTESTSNDSSSSNSSSSGDSSSSNDSSSSGTSGSPSGGSSSTGGTGDRGSTGGGPSHSGPSGGSTSDGAPSTSTNSASTNSTPGDTSSVAGPGQSPDGGSSSTPSHSSSAPSGLTPFDAGYRETHGDGAPSADSSPDSSTGPSPSSSTPTASPDSSPSPDSGSTPDASPTPDRSPAPEAGGPDSSPNSAPDHGSPAPDAGGRPDSDASPTPAHADGPAVTTSEHHTTTSDPGPDTSRSSDPSPSSSSPDPSSSSPDPSPSSPDPSPSSSPSPDPSPSSSPSPDSGNQSHASVPSPSPAPDNAPAAGPGPDHSTPPNDHDNGATGGGRGAMPQGAMPQGAPSAGHSAPTSYGSPQQHAPGRPDDEASTTVHTESATLAPPPPTAVPQQAPGHGDSSGSSAPSTASGAQSPQPGMAMGGGPMPTPSAPAGAAPAAAPPRSAPTGSGTTPHANPAGDPRTVPSGESRGASPRQRSGAPDQASRPRPTPPRAEPPRPTQPRAEQPRGDDSPPHQPQTPPSNGPEHDGPDQHTPKQNTPDQSTPDQSTPDQDTPDQDTPEQSPPVQTAPPNDGTPPAPDHGTDTPEAGHPADQPDAGPDDQNTPDSAQKPDGEPDSVNEPAPDEDSAPDKDQNDPQNQAPDNPGPEQQPESHDSDSDPDSESADSTQQDDNQHDDQSDDSQSDDSKDDDATSDTSDQPGDDGSSDTDADTDTDAQSDPDAESDPDAQSDTEPDAHDDRPSLDEVRAGIQEAPGGLLPPDTADQQALENAVPRNDDGTPQRFPDPSGDWSQIQNDGGTDVPGRSNNCADCSRSFLETWYGNPQVSAPRTPDLNPDGSPDRWSPETNANENIIDWTGAPHSYAGTSPDGHAAIAQDLLNAGPGSSAIVQVNWAGGGGHAFNAVNHNGKVVWVDTQSGEVSDQPINTDGATDVFYIPMDADRNPLYPAPDADSDSHTSNDDSDTADNDSHASDNDSSTADDGSHASDNDSSTTDDGSSTASNHSGDPEAESSSSAPSDAAQDHGSQAHDAPHSDPASGSPSDPTQHSPETQQTPDSPDTPQADTPQGDGKQADHTPTDSAPSDQSPSPQAPSDQSPSDHSPQDHSPQDQSPSDPTPSDPSPGDSDTTANASDPGKESPDDGPSEATGDHGKPDGDPSDTATTASGTPDSPDASRPEGSDAPPRPDHDESTSLASDTPANGPVGGPPRPDGNQGQADPGDRSRTPGDAPRREGDPDGAGRPTSGRPDATLPTPDSRPQHTPPGARPKSPIPEAPGGKRKAGGPPADPDNANAESSTTDKKKRTDPDHHQFAAMKISDSPPEHDDSAMDVDKEPYSDPHDRGDSDTTAQEKEGKTTLDAEGDGSKEYGLSPDKLQAQLRRDRPVHRIPLDNVRDHLDRWADDGSLANTLRASTGHALPSSPDAGNGPRAFTKKDLENRLPGFKDMDHGEQLAVVTSLARLSVGFHEQHGVGKNPENIDKPYRNKDEGDPKPETKDSVAKDSVESLGVRGHRQSSDKFLQDLENPDSHPDSLKDNAPDLTERNYAVLEVEGPPPARETHYVTDSSVPVGEKFVSGRHSEKHLADWLNRVNQGDTKYTPKAVYTEREPCGNGRGHAKCSTVLRGKTLDDTKVYYSTTYRTDPADDKAKKQLDSQKQVEKKNVDKMSAADVKRDLVESINDRQGRTADWKAKQVAAAGNLTDDKAREELKKAIERDYKKLKDDATTPEKRAIAREMDRHFDHLESTWRKIQPSLM
ncbi:toxin glutamine deamidase domain-containing protein [Streptomyces sp. NPDC048650]|uniref:toxin glutamine deamidase domain-containing protein n=1 Tax=Streptomyces sp. NPDC048650 TaxID=3365583 RepID=UPI00371E0C64